MMFLLLLVPLAVLCAVLAWMSWRARHRQVALIMAGVSLVCSGLSVGIILAAIILYDAVQWPMAG